MGRRESKSISAHVHRSKPMSENGEDNEKRYSEEVEEEKKEGTPHRPGTEKKAQNPFASEQADLPAVFWGKKYIDESSFLQDLEPFSDLQIALNEEGYAVWRKMPGNAHNDAVKMISRLFQTWKLQKNCGVEEYEEPNILVTRSYSPKRRGSGERHPDFSIYGPDRLDQFRSVRVHEVDGERGPQVENPHVIIQFGWANEDIYETYAIDDIMNYAGIGKYHLLKPPEVAYLIKAMWKGKRGESPVFGFNIYEVRHGERRQDVEPTLYRVGGQQDVQVMVIAADMGVTGDEVDPFTIDVHEIRRLLECKKYAVFEAEAAGGTT